MGIDAQREIAPQSTEWVALRLVRADEASLTVETDVASRLPDLSVDDSAAAALAVSGWRAVVRVRKPTNPNLAVHEGLWQLVEQRSSGRDPYTVFRERDVEVVLRVSGDVPSERKVVEEFGAALGAIVNPYGLTEPQYGIFSVAPSHPPVGPKTPLRRVQ